MNAEQKKKWNYLSNKMDKLSKTHDSIYMDWIDGYDSIVDLWWGYMNSLEGSKADGELEELEEFLKEIEDEDIEESRRPRGCMLREGRSLYKNRKSNDTEGNYIYTIARCTSDFQVLEVENEGPYEYSNYEDAFEDGMNTLKRAYNDGYYCLEVWDLNAGPDLVCYAESDHGKIKVLK